MTKPIISDQDILADALSEKVTATSGCIDILSFGGCSLKVCWEVHLTEIKVRAVFETPFGDLDLGSGTLTPSNAKIELGVSKRGYKAKVTITADFSALTLEICGEIKVPILGSKKGCTTIQL